MALDIPHCPSNLPCDQTAERRTPPAIESESVRHRALQLKIKIVSWATILAILLGFLYWFCSHYVKRAHDEGDNGGIRQINANPSDYANAQGSLQQFYQFFLDASMIPTVTQLGALQPLRTPIGTPDDADVRHPQKEMKMMSSNPLISTGRVARLEQSILEEQRKLPMWRSTSLQAGFGRAFLSAPVCKGFTPKGPR